MNGPKLKSSPRYHLCAFAGGRPSATPLQAARHHQRPGPPAVPMPPDLRLMTPADLPGVAAVQQACYAPDFHEPVESFAAKLRRSPQTCWVALSQALTAYLVTLPVSEATFPALHATEWAPPEVPTMLYLHDLAVSPQGQGAHLGERLIGLAEKAARAMGLRTLALVAVQGSVPYWQRRGFVLTEPAHPALAAKLASFGGDARFMLRQV